MTNTVKLAAIAAILGNVSVSAAPIPPVPEQTVVALQLLLRAGGQFIPRNSTCFGQYGQSGAPRIYDLLSSRFAYLHNGQNVISGWCEAQRCKVEIRHSAGEDVASATISFREQGGALQIRSLGCVLTP